MPRSERGRAGWPLAAAGSGLWLAGSLTLLACDAAPARVLFGAPAAGSGGLAASAQSGASGAAGAGLHAVIEVGSSELRCGECTQLEVHARGGSEPYTIALTDPALVGPGPHTVCPQATTSYVAAVVDARGQVVLATAAVPCSVAGPAAGAPAPPVAGSGAPTATCFGRAPLDSGVTCQADPVGLPISRSIALSQPMGVGVAHSALLSLQSLQSTLASGLTFRLYGARSPCQPEQLLGTFALTAAVSGYGACFVPEQAYAHVVAVSDVSAIGLPVVDGMSFCNVGCAVIGE